MKHASEIMLESLNKAHEEASKGDPIHEIINALLLVAAEARAQAEVSTQRQRTRAEWAHDLRTPRLDQDFAGDMVVRMAKEFTRDRAASDAAYSRLQSKAAKQGTAIARLHDRVAMLQKMSRVHNDTARKEAFRSVMREADVVRLIVATSDLVEHVNERTIQKDYRYRVYAVRRALNALNGTGDE